MKTQQDVDELIAWMQLHLPRFEVRYKDEHRLQRWIGRLMQPINDGYMNIYTTVMFGHVYFPSREIVAQWGPHRVYKILRHEFVHLMDAKRFPLWFEFSYIFLLPFVWTMRGFWEYRGYVQNFIVEYEVTGTISEHTYHFVEERFVNSEYAWMFPFRRRLRRYFAATTEAIRQGTLQGPYPYAPLEPPWPFEKETETPS